VVVTKYSQIVAPMLSIIFQEIAGKCEKISRLAAQTIFSHTKPRLGELMGLGMGELWVLLE
jgi:hypothetical protein